MLDVAGHHSMPYSVIVMKIQIKREYKNFINTHRSSNFKQFSAIDNYGYPN